MPKTVCGLMLAFAVLSAGYAQTTPAPVAAAEKKAVIEALCQKLDGEYIFPEVTAKYVRMLRDNLQSGRYDAIGQPQEFAARLTSDLMAIHRDLHLSIRFNPAWVSEDKNKKELDEDAIKRAGRRERIENYGFQELKILPGNIGYLKLNAFTYDTEAQAAAVGAMAFLSNADALIVDLRDNGGGSPEMVQFLCSYFLANPRQHLNSFSYKDPEKLTQYWTYTYLPGPRLDKPDLYLLTSDSTFSAAEEFAYNLKNLKRATVVGETTGGGAHDNKFVALTDRFMMSLPFARALNPVTKSNWEEVGVEPNVKVARDKALASALTLASHKLAEAEKDPEFKRYYQWHSESYQAATNPPALGEAALRPYVGVYGPRTISLEGGALFYQRQQQSKIKLIPMGEDVFGLEGNPNFRIKFFMEGGRVAAVEGRNPNGPTDRHERNK